MSGLIQNLPAGVLASLQGGDGGGGDTFNLDVATPFQQNLQGIEDVLAQGRTSADEQARPFKTKTETGPDGNLITTVSGPHEEILKIKEKMALLDQILGSFHERSSYLQAQEQAGRQRSPILAALNSVAGNLAAGDKRLPPIVQALGRANLEMNPSQQVLGQRAQEASMAEAAVAKEQAGLAQASLGLQIEEERVKEQAKQKQENLKLAQEKVEDAKIKTLNQQARLVAQKSGGQPMAFKAFDAMMRQGGIKDPEKIQQAYIAHEEEAFAFKHGQDEANKNRLAQIQAGVAARGRQADELEDRRFGHHLAIERDRFANSISPNALAAKKSLIDYGAKVHEEVAKDKELSVIGAADTKKLESAAQTDSYVDKLQGALSRPELKGLVGPLFTAYKDKKTGEWTLSLNAQKVLPRFAQSADRAEVEALMQHEIPRIMSTVLNLQGGASILRSEEGRKMVAKLGASINDRPDQIAQILETIRDTNNDTRSSVMKGHPKVDWQSRSDLMGFDNPNNARYWKGGKDSMGGKVQLPSSLSGGGAKPEPPPKTELQKLKPGQGLKDKNGNVWDGDGNLVSRAR
jgi:hypothetical protein